MRFKLPKKAFEELKELVKRRDRELAYIYKKYIEEDPPYQNIEIHHHKHVGNFGADKEDNLISLSWNYHRLKCHGLSWEIKKEADRRVGDYLTCGAVKTWREKHREELKAIYAKENDYREKTLQKKHKVNKRYPWAKY